MATDLLSTEYEPIQPKGLALALLIVTVVFTILSSIIAVLRFHVRISLQAFSTEDWLMLAGWLLNLFHNASCIMLAFSGIGSHDDVISLGNQMKIGLWTVIWQFVYVLDGALIKSSIIWTLLRLARDLNKVYTRILWGLFAFSWIVWFISWPVAIFQCKPVAAAWGEPGDCTSGQVVILRVSYFVSAANIFTDVATALVPMFLLRHLQLPRRVKVVTVGVLSLGVFASVATTIRISYTWAYAAKKDKFFVIGKVVLLTVLETDLGIIAGSMPMLRRLVQALGSSNRSTKTPGSGPRDINLVTIGGSRRTHMKLTEAGASRAEPEPGHSQDKESTGDDESTRHMIYVTREVEQDSVLDHSAPGNQFHTAVSGKHTMV